MTFYVFAFVLFAVNFVISLLLFGAANDRKKMMRIQEQLKRLGAASEKENYRLRENSQHAIEIVNQKIVQAQNVMGDMDGKILDIQNRSQDLAKLQATLANYRQVMGQLASITDQAEARIQEIRGDIAEVEQIRQTIARFQEDTAKEKTAIETMRTEGETALKTMREENEAAVKSLLAASEEKLTGFQKQVEELMEKTKSSIDSYTEALEKQKQDALQAVEEQGKKFGEFEQQMKESLQKSEDDFKRLRFETVGQVDKDMSNFTISCAEKMETVFKQTIEQIDASFHTMVSTSQVFINELDGRLASAKDIAATLDANSAQRLEEVSKKLAEYTHQLTNNEALNATQESHKQQMEQSIDELQAETDALHGELERLKTEKAEIVREMEERAEHMADDVASVPAQAPENPDGSGPNIWPTMSPRFPPRLPKTLMTKSRCSISNRFLPALSTPSKKRPPTRMQYLVERMRNKPQPHRHLPRKPNLSCISSSPMRLLAPTNRRRYLLMCIPRQGWHSKRTPHLVTRKRRKFQPHRRPPRESNPRWIPSFHQKTWVWMSRSQKLFPRKSRLLTTFLGQNRNPNRKRRRSLWRTTSLSWMTWNRWRPRKPRRSNRPMCLSGKRSRSIWTTDFLQKKWPSRIFHVNICIYFASMK